MKFCQPHWSDLRAAIDARGLTPLVAADGRTAARNMAAELHGQPESIKTFDPLMSAHWAIASNALELVGMRLMFGELCPICEVNEEAPRHGKPATFADDWVNLAADGAARRVAELTAEGKPDA